MAEPEANGQWVSDCDTCKRYLGARKKNKLLLCYQASYYTPGQISFCRSQMLWLIKFVLPQTGDEWPSEAYDTGSEGADTKVLHCPFEAISCIRAELEDRLSMIGNDRQTLVWEVQHGLDSYEILSPRARLALDYISGWRRRKKSYPKWCYVAEHKREKNHFYDT